jgi:hypothetical protein
MPAQPQKVATRSCQSSAEVFEELSGRPAALAGTADDHGHMNRPMSRVGPHQNGQSVSSVWISVAWGHYERSAWNDRSAALVLALGGYAQEQPMMN